MKNTNWNLVESGEIVSFRYKSRSGRSVNRTVLCLDPFYRYKKQSTKRIVEFFIGLELHADDKPRIQKSILQQLFKILETGGDATPSQTSAQEMEKIYLRLKNWLERNPIFKTYLLRKCRRNRIFLENKFKELNGIQIKQAAEKVIKPLLKEEDVTKVISTKLLDKTINNTLSEEE